MPCEIYTQNHRKILLKKLFFSNVATTLLKTEFFTGGNQRFWLKLLDHLFCGVVLSGCFLSKSCLVKLATSDVTTKRRFKNSSSEICDRNPQRIHVNQIVFNKTRSP